MKISAIAISFENQMTWSQEFESTATPAEILKSLAEQAECSPQEVEEILIISGEVTQVLSPANDDAGIWGEEEDE